MDKDSVDIITLVVKGIPAMGLSLFGGFVEIMSSNRAIKVRQLIGTFGAAALVGLVLYLLLYNVDVHESIKAALIAMSGASARTTMQLLQERGQKLIQKVLK